MGGAGGQVGDPHEPRVDGGVDVAVAQPGEHRPGHRRGVRDRQRGAADLPRVGPGDQSRPAPAHRAGWTGPPWRATCRSPASAAASRSAASRRCLPGEAPPVNLVSNPNAVGVVGGGVGIGFRATDPEQHHLPPVAAGGRVQVDAVGAEVDVMLGVGGADALETGPGRPVRVPGVRGRDHLQVVVHPRRQHGGQGPGGGEGGLVQVVLLREERARDRHQHPRPHRVRGDQRAVGDQHRCRRRGVDPADLFPGVPSDHRRHAPSVGCRSAVTASRCGPRGSGGHAGQQRVTGWSAARRLVRQGLVVPGHDGHPPGLVPADRPVHQDERRHDVGLRPEPGEQRHPHQQQQKHPGTATATPIVNTRRWMPLPEALVEQLVLLGLQPQAGGVRRQLQGHRVTHPRSGWAPGSCTGAGAVVVPEVADV